VNEDHLFFGFEKDFAKSLRCIPMLVRFKTDQCAVKLSLRQWFHFSQGDRYALLSLPCQTPDEIQFYRTYLIELISARTKEQAKEIAVDATPAWANIREVPEQLISFARSRELAPPTMHQWSQLSPLQRFTLMKLTHDGDDNGNFVPAMHEFGLMEENTPSRESVSILNEEAE
jgi:hypothetical protein